MSATVRVSPRENPPTEAENSSRELPVLWESEDAEPNVLFHVQLLWDQRRYLSRAAIAVLLASLLVAFLIPARFQSVTQLMPPEAQSLSGAGALAAMAGRAAGGNGLSAIAGDLLGGGSNSGALFVGILASQTVQDRLIQQFNLRHVYWVSKIEDAREKLAKHTSLAEDRKSGIITVAVIDHDPQRAAAMAQAYVAELDRLVAEVSTSSARRERIFLEGRLRQVKSELDAAAGRFSDFASKNTAIDIPAQGKAMVEAAATLQGHLIAAESELSGLEQVYTSNNVRVRSLQARVNELRQQLDKMGGDMSGDGAPGVGTNGESESALYPSIRRLPILGVTYADLYRQTKIEETVYELLTQQYELAKIQEAKEIPAVKVLDPAEVPTKRSFPPRMLIVFAGVVLGMTAAVAGIHAQAAWQKVAESDPWKILARQVQATVLARLPWLAGVSAGAHSARKSIWSWRPGRRLAE